MGRAKEIRVRIIPAKIGNEFIRRYHYSGKVVNNSILHFGAFLDDRLHGVMSFGSPMDKRKVLGLVEPTKWNEMLELNRMAFDDYLPRNSESRCISIALNLIRKNAPHIKWVLSYSDGTQCGDGVIYRASGFALTQIKKNTTIIRLKNGQVMANLAFHLGKNAMKQGGRAGIPEGAKPLDGFQMRYIYLLDKKCKIMVPILPFSAINEAGAGMYLGKKREVSRTANASGLHPEEGGRHDHLALKNSATKQPNHAES